MPQKTEEEPIATGPDDVEMLVAENASLRDRLLRALADAENTRRQAEMRVEDTRKFAVADFAREVLIVLDNLERTIAAARSETKNSLEHASLIEGVEATLRILVRTMERFGIRRIDALGQRFDPNLHEAAMAVEDPSKPPSTVIQVLDQGYTIQNRLLRPARVVVTRSKAPAELPDDNDLGSEWGTFE